MTSSRPISITARLEVECWLDPESRRQEDAEPRSLHATLLAAMEAGCRPADLVQQLNAAAESTLQTCIASLNVAQSERLIYASKEIDADGSTFVWADTFAGRRTWGDPLFALLELKRLRQSDVDEQVTALLYEIACEREEVASWIFPSECPGDDDVSAEQSVAPPSLEIGEETVHRQSNTAREARERERGRQAAVSTAKRRRVRLEQRTLKELRPVCREIRMALQSFGNGAPPAAIVLPIAANLDESAAIAGAYESLSADLPHLGRCKISGPGRIRAVQAWKQIASVKGVLRVIGGWIRGLGGPVSARQCDLCYRHRATKKRCSVHVAKFGVTPAIRLARAVQSHYIHYSSSLLRAAPRKWAWAAPPDWRPLESIARASGVPAPLVRQTCILAAQLRTFYPQLNAPLAARVAEVFQTLVQHAKNLVGSGMPGATPSGTLGGKARQASALLTLRTFSTVWFATGRPFPITAPTLYGCGHDPAHPLLRGAGVSERELGKSLSLQRAWTSALEEYRRRVCVDHATVAALRAEGLSFDEIGRRFGFSHETARQLYRDGDRGRSRTRFAPYSAKSRLRSSS